MTQQNINIGSNANDGTGDDLRAAMLKINNNFTELYGSTSEANDLIEDTSPQLGGALDVNGYSIVSASNGNISIVPNGTGLLTLGAVKINGTTISSDDSTKITLAEHVDVTGTLNVSTIETNNISSADSSAIQINDAVNVSGTLTAESLLTNTISSPDSSRLYIEDALQVSGWLYVNQLLSGDSSAIQIDDGVNIAGTTTTSTLFVNDDNITIARRWNDDSTRTSSVGKSGDTVGMIAWEDDHVYVCTANYDGITQIWKRAALSTF